MRIFLSYRREDSSAWAGRLHDSLATRFGERNIFQDVVAVGPGEDFTAAIDRALGDADATLVVIGPTWLTAAAPGGVRRLDEPDDYVRAELSAALAREAPVVPVLVGGAEMPSASDLPAGLGPLAQRQAVTLRDTTWRQDVDGLVQSLRGEQPAGTRKRWPIVAGVAAVLLVAGAIVLILLRDGDSDGDGDGGSTALTGCPGEVADWPPIGIAGEPHVEIDGADGSWTSDVLDGFQRADEDATWLTVLVVDGTNRTTDVMYHEPFTYELVIDGIEFPPDCFSVISGNDPISPDSRNRALVGFPVNIEPAASDLALDVSFAGQTERIDLDGTEG
jgi:hypothetical protein